VSFLSEQAGFESEHDKGKNHCVIAGAEQPWTRSMTSPVDRNETCPATGRSTKHHQPVGRPPAAADRPRCLDRLVGPDGPVLDRRDLLADDTRRRGCAAHVPAIRCPFRRRDVSGIVGDRVQDTRASRWPCHIDRDHHDGNRRGVDRHDDTGHRSRRCSPRSPTRIARRAAGTSRWA